MISVDDVCRSFYSVSPERCGTGLSSAYEGQIMHQPAWSLYDAIKLAGVDPTRSGYTIAPHLPFGRFSLRFPDVGVAYGARCARGYLIPQRTASLRLHVKVPAGTGPVATWANGHRVGHSLHGGFVSFPLTGHVGHPADWAVTRGTVSRSACQ